MNCQILKIVFVFFVVPFSFITAESQNKYDISSFGELSYWSAQTGADGKRINPNAIIAVPQSSEKEWNIGLLWKEERDVESIEVNYSNTPDEKLLEGTIIQYWFQTWPGAAPKEHTIEDPMDDPWQGEWITAKTNYTIKGKQVTYSFKPLSTEENKQANNLPNPVNYRRALKFRLVYSVKPSFIESLRAFSPTKGKEMSLKIEFGCDRSLSKTVDGKLEIFNGKINKIVGFQWKSGDKVLPLNSWRIKLNNSSKVIIADIIAAQPSLPGSNDPTIITVRSSEGNFSFSAADLEQGPIYIPAYSVYITMASDTVKFKNQKVRKGQTIRERIPREPEQTYARASREIPALNVMLREDGGKLYIPLAADASWQKFAFEWGGGFYMNKRSTKAKGNELTRCNWNGNELRWWIGTGKDPVYNRDDKNSHMSVMNGYMPVAEVSWNQDGIIYKEEAFASLLEGPLSPYDKDRNEQTPAILMIRLKIENPSFENKSAHVWLKAENLASPSLQNLFVMDQINGKNYIRAHIKLPEKSIPSQVKLIDHAIDIPLEIEANQSSEIIISVPFVGDLTDKEKEKFVLLNYSDQLNKVVEYWRDLVNEFVPFDVPEQKFCDMSRSVIPHIRMSTTKDPRSGLFMVPAASFGYQVYANESAFQIVMLDRIGDHKTAESYLETFLRLQGTLPMPGTFTGDQKAVFHGGKVDNEYNYTSGPYNLDHGTVLWALGLHYLITKDAAWLKHSSGAMLRAADWIVEQRNQTKIKNLKGEEVLHYGLLPAGRLEDNADWGFWFAVNAYAYLGLKTTADAFIAAGLADGKRLKKEAEAYLKDLRTSIKRTSELSPVVKLRNNTYVPYVPSRAYQRFRYFGPMQSGYYSRYGKNTSLTYRLSATREALYGPIILITTGILDPKDPLSEAILDDWEDNITLSSSLGQHIHGVVDDEYWFSRGGMVFQPNLQNPIQSYLLRNEIPAAIRSIYNSMVSCLYPDVNAFTEEYRRWSVGSGPMYKIPDEARFVNRVCDLLVLESGNELWLAPGTPRYWLEPGKSIKLNNTATIFGNVSYELKCGTKSNTIEALINLPENNTAEKVRLFVRAPLGKQIKSVQLNGKKWNNWDAEKEAIILPKEMSKINVLISY